VPAVPWEEIFVRPIQTPDGMINIVALSGWFWNSLAWMEANSDWNTKRFSRLAWQTLQNESDWNMPGWKAEFSKLFECAIYIRMYQFIEKADGVANDNI
jgi:hypothetical protein